jgi:hypothetical protein
LGFGFLQKNDGAKAGQGLNNELSSAHGAAAGAA